MFLRPYSSHSRYLKIAQHSMRMHACYQFDQREFRLEEPPKPQAASAAFALAAMFAGWRGYPSG